MKGFIYCLTCSETNKKYFGSTSNLLEVRKNKGWCKCSCNDFINPTIEIMEEIDYVDIKELLLMENKYILENECVNNNLAIRTRETDKNYHKKYREENSDAIKISVDKYRKKVLEPIKCPLCNRQTSKKHLKRHQKTKLCKQNRLSP